MLIEKQLLIPLVKCFSSVILALKNTGCLSFSPHAQPSIITCHSVLVSRRNIWENYQLLHFQPSINGCKTQNTIRLNPRAPLGASKNTSQGETWDWNGFQVFSPGFLPVGEKKKSDSESFEQDHWNWLKTMGLVVVTNVWDLFSRCNVFKVCSCNISLAM